MLDLVEIPEPRTVRTADGRTVGYYEYGDPSGTPVVALHGTPACGAGFAWGSARAQARGIRLLAPDRPGIGESDVWDPGRGSIVEHYAAALDAFANALGLGAFPVVGYSGGGPYALAAARAYPDRIPAVAVVSGAGQVGEWAAMHEFETSDRFLTGLAGRAPALARASLTMSAIASRLAPKASLRFAQIEMNASDRSVMAEFPDARAALAVFTQACRHGSQGVVDDYAALGRSWGFAVEDIRVPVRCWHGTDDRVVPLRHSDELVQRIPDAHLTPWDGGGHLAVVRRVGEVFDSLQEIVR